MWLLTPFGCFSTVQKQGTSHLTVRARVRADLDALRDRYLPSLSATVDHAGSDYPYRATVSHAEFGAALARIGVDIDYDNFKDEVDARQGHRRAAVYAKVWTALHQGLEPLDEAAGRPATRR